MELAEVFTVLRITSVGTHSGAPPSPVGSKKGETKAESEMCNFDVYLPQLTTYPTQKSG